MWILFFLKGQFDRNHIKFRKKSLFIAKSKPIKNFTFVP